MADRRIIAIAVTPKAYDEIQKLKSDRTWTGYLIELVLLENPRNQVLTDELANLPKKEVKEQKPKAEKKAKKEKKAAKSEKVEKAEAETEVPSAEEAERVEVEGKGTLIMPHTHKTKKAKVQEPSAKVTEQPTAEQEPTDDELKAEVPIGESLGISTPVNKGEG